MNKKININMKTIHWILVTIIALGLSLTACNNAQKSQDKDASADTPSEKETALKPQTIAIDTVNSVVQWTGALVGVYKHHGTIKFKKGTLTVKGDKIVKGSFVADLTTMKATDKNYKPDEGKTKEKLIKHLSSPDFFNVKKYPDASFKIQEHKANSITGQLTIRDNTHQETVNDVKIKTTKGKYKFTGKLTFDRQKYDVSWKHPMKDKALSDDIELKIVLKSK